MVEEIEDILVRVILFLDSNRSILRCQSRRPWAKDSHQQIRSLVTSLGYNLEETALHMHGCTKIGRRKSKRCIMSRGSLCYCVHKVNFHPEPCQRIALIYWCMTFDVPDIFKHTTAQKRIFIQSSIHGPDLSIDPRCRIDLEWYPERWKHLYDDECTEFFVFHLVLLRLKVYLDESIRYLILHYLRYTQTRCLRGRYCVCRGEATTCPAPRYKRVSIIDSVLKIDSRSLVNDMVSKRRRKYQQ